MVQVNESTTSDAYDAYVNHRANGSRAACRDVVSRALTRVGAIGTYATALLRTEDARLFNDQYVVKPPARGCASLQMSCFAWHYDSQWCHDDVDWTCAPYVSCWVALDDVSEENGALRMLPYPPAQAGASHRERANSYPDRDTLPSPLDEDGCEIGRLLTMRAGSVVFFSDVVLHCSGPNLSGSIRRAWMPQISAGPVVRRDDSPVSLTAKLASL